MHRQDDVLLQTIVAHCADPQFNVTALAEITGHSTSYLCEKSYSIYGMSTKQVIETVRLEQAIMLLATDDNKIDYVRMRAGYEYAKSFRRVFKKRLGLTPCECKEKILCAESKKSEIERLLRLIWKADR